MILEEAESLASEYIGSEHYMFVNPDAKVGSESVLLAFFRLVRDAGINAMADLKAKDVEAALMNGMPRLDVTVSVKRAIPDLLEGFFAFLRGTGRFPPAGAWEMCVEANRKKYLDSLREDGSVKGSTFKKRYTDVGRNDPCPCGSGKKFKKCCMELIQ